MPIHLNRCETFSRSSTRRPYRTRFGLSRRDKGPNRNEGCPTQPPHQFTRSLSTLTRVVLVGHRGTLEFPRHSHSHGVMLSFVLVGSWSGDDSLSTRDATDFLAHLIIRELQGQAWCQKVVYWTGWGQYWNFLSIVFLGGLGSCLFIFFGGFGIITIINITPGYHVMSLTHGTLADYEGSDEPGTADGRLGKKASGSDAYFPSRQLSLPLSISLY